MVRNCSKTVLWPAGKNKPKKRRNDTIIGSANKTVHLGHFTMGVTLNQQDFQVAPKVIIVSHMKHPLKYKIYWTLIHMHGSRTHTASPGYPNIDTLAFAFDRITKINYISRTLFKHCMCLHRQMPPSQYLPNMHSKKR